MIFEPPLQHAILIKRYKRFLVDVSKGKTDFTMHCPNTGAMTGCAEPGSIAWYSTSDNPKRKYPNTLEIVKSPIGHFIGVNTHRANYLVAEALQNNLISGFEDCNFKAEVKQGDSRLDFVVNTAKGEHYLEVKSVTLGPLNETDENLGYFPDAVSVRAIKHLQELTRLVAEGHQATLLFCVQHSGIDKVLPATHIHPEYTSELRKAHENGVRIRAFKTKIICNESEQLIELKEEIPVILPR